MLFSKPPAGLAFESHETVDGGNGRIAVRRHTVCTDVGWMSGDRRYPGEPRFPDLAMLGRVETEVEREAAMAPLNGTFEQGDYRVVLVEVNPSQRVAGLSHLSEDSHGPSKLRSSPIKNCHYTVTQLDPDRTAYARARPEYLVMQGNATATLLWGLVA